MERLLALTVRGRAVSVGLEVTGNGWKAWTVAPDLCSPGAPRTFDGRALRTSGRVHGNRDAALTGALITVGATLAGLGDAVSEVIEVGGAPRLALRVELANAEARVNATALQLDTARREHSNTGAVAARDARALALAEWNLTALRTALTEAQNFIKALCAGDA